MEVVERRGSLYLAAPLLARLAAWPADEQLAALSLDSHLRSERLASCHVVATHVVGVDVLSAPMAEGESKAGSDLRCLINTRRDGWAAGAEVETPVAVPAYVIGPTRLGEVISLAVAPLAPCR